MPTEQLTLFNTHKKDEYYFEDYVITKSNIHAHKYITESTWCTHCAILYGIKGSGKTHLTQIWQRANNALCKPELTKYNQPKACFIEDIDKLNNDKYLLHIYNLSKEYNAKLLLTTSVKDFTTYITLPDLLSRLTSSLMVEIIPPDDAMLHIMIVKQFAKKQIRIDKKIPNYLLKHYKRSFTHLKKIIDIVDNTSFSLQREITIPLIQQIIKDHE